MRLSIHDIVGPRCITKEDGQRNFDKIHNVLIENEEVTLDFKGVTQFASPFFNFAIGQLLKDLTPENLKSLLKIENLLEDGKLVVDRVIENASRYIIDEDYRKIVDTILKKQSEESE